MSLVETARNVLLKAIAYKFAVRAEISEILMLGEITPAHRVARELSKAVADFYSGGKVDKQNLKKALEKANFF